MTLNANVPPRRPVPQGKQRICVAGFTSPCPYTSYARNLAGRIAASHPDRYESWFYFEEDDEYFRFLKVFFDPVPFPDHLKGHSSSPFVWIETGPNIISELIGGSDHFAEWARKTFPEDQTIQHDARSTCYSCRVTCCGPTWRHAADPNAAQSTADVRAMS